MTKQARSAVTRERIIESAARVFDRYGYAGSTLGDIVKQSGYTKGAVYFHFKSKEDVAAAVVDAQHDRSAHLAASATGETRGLAAAIRTAHLLGRQIVSDVLVRAGMKLTLEQSNISTALATPYKDWIAMTAQFFDEAVADGEVREDIDPVMVANFLVGSFTGLQLLSGAVSAREDLPERVQQMWELLLPSLVPARKLAHFSRLNALHAGPAA